jgi:hypothetical protein
MASVPDVFATCVPADGSDARLDWCITSTGLSLGLLLVVVLLS